ncbi:MAG: SDR family NAD(P)-dependent oxidoreductase [Acetobacteraceae bacterium]|jgi:NAD(P)-dependent dehydrogenase (short-subunit alcohol dehydrogenase family)
MKFTIPATIPRAALITGGAQQLAIAGALEGAGFAIALQCHTDIELDPPGSAVLLPADLSDEDQTASLLDRAATALNQPIGVLVNGASAHGRDTWDAATRATWDMHIETNLRAPMVLTQQFARALPASQEGVVINLLDQRICPQLVSYTLSKAALWTLTQTMALALAPRIRVNGIVLTGGNAADEAAQDNAPRFANRETSADEIGRAVLAILALTSMTGQMIVPDGAPPPPA